MKHEDDVDPGIPVEPSEDEVRRLLQGLRAEDPVPPELGSRLEDTLASLQAERSTAPLPRADDRSRIARTPRPVRVGLALAAGVAAAVGAGGLVLPLISGGGSESDSAAGMASRPASSDGSGPERAEAASGADDSAVNQALPQLSRSDFARQVNRQLLKRESAAAALDSRPSPAPAADGVRDLDDASSSVARPQGAAPPATSPATCDAGVTPGPRQRSFLARLEDRPVLVVAGPARALAYACADDDALSLTSRPEPLLSRPLD